MRYVLVVAAALALSVGGAVIVGGGDDRRPVAAPVADHAEGEEAEQEEEGLGPAEPDDYFLLQRSRRGTLPSTGEFRRALRQTRAVRARAAVAPRRWQLVGPTNIGGRIVDVAVDSRRPDTIYAAAATGGVWRSTDAGATLQPAWSDANTQSMGALALAGDGTLWAGTGELNPGGGSITFGGTGVFRSTDGGLSWHNRGLTRSGTTGRIAVDPSNPRRLFVAAGGSLFNPGGQRGIYRSTNGGNSWRRVLDPETPFTGGADLAIDPTNPERIFAAMWDHRREPDKRTYGGVGSGLFRSDDGGDTWTRLENVGAKTPSDATGLVSDASLGRIGVALAPGDPNRVYVITTATFGQDKGFYVSRDGGDTFTTATHPGSQGGFGWWFGRLWVDPANADHVFVAGVSLRESLDGGQTWRNSSGVHADQHAMAWAAGHVYLGNDGGVYRSDGGGAPGTWTKATYEPYTQLYQTEVAESDPSRVTAGAQDNGCLRSFGAAGWNSYGCGDGQYVPIDPVDPNIFYGCSQYGSCTRQNDNLIGQPGFRRNIQQGATSQRWNWHAPLVIDPNDPATLYFAGNVLNRSTNRGDAWTAISPPGPDDLTGTFESPDRVDPAYPNWGTITTVSVAKTAPQTLYAGTDTGRLWRTTDLGAHWTEFSGLPRRWVTRVAIDPRDDDVVYATFSGFRNGEDAAHVYRTTDGGRHWRNVSTNLPNAPVNDVVLGRRSVYVASDVGVYALRGRSRGWRPVGAGLPLSPVLDLRLHTPSHTLFAATFGRSVWKVDGGR
jgi:photosystem II stability/assembly factor-like uncharacterized protein